MPHLPEQWREISQLPKQKDVRGLNSESMKSEKCSILYTSPAQSQKRRKEYPEHWLSRTYGKLQQIRMVATKCLCNLRRCLPLYRSQLPGGDTSNHDKAVGSYFIVSYFYISSCVRTIQHPVRIKTMEN